MEIVSLCMVLEGTHGHRSVQWDVWLGVIGDACGQIGAVAIPFVPHGSGMQVVVLVVLVRVGHE